MPSQQIAINTDTYVDSLALLPVTGTPTIRIGTTANGTDIMGDTVISGFNQVTVNKYFQAGGILYVTQSANNGTVSLRVNVSNNYFNLLP